MVEERLTSGGIESNPDELPARGALRFVPQAIGQPLGREGQIQRKLVDVGAVKLGSPPLVGFRDDGLGERRPRGCHQEKEGEQAIAVCVHGCPYLVAEIGGAHHGTGSLPALPRACLKAFWRRKWGLPPDLRNFPGPKNRDHRVNDVESRFLATPEKGEVSALLRLPPGAAAILVLGHGFGAGMRHRNLEALAAGLDNRGIGTFRYQFPYMERGRGRDSEGTSLATVRAAVAAAGRAAQGLPLLAGGQSYGGRMTSLAAARLGEEDDPMRTLAGVVYFNFPLHAPGKPSVHRAAHLGDIQVPQLFLSGTRDALAQIDLLDATIAGLDERVRLHLIDTANHSFGVLKRTRQSDEDPILEACRVTREWFDGMRDAEGPRL